MSAGYVVRFQVQIGNDQVGGDTYIDNDYPCSADVAIQKLKGLSSLGIPGLLGAIDEAIDFIQRVKNGGGISRGQGRPTVFREQFGDGYRLDIEVQSGSDHFR